jgi:GNAT superfamily N-acetyltransferase
MGSFSAASPITLKPVQSAADRRLFARTAHRVYPKESPWIPPLDLIVMDYLNPANPFFRDGEGQAYVILERGRPVGRLLAHVWRRHHRLHKERVGYFGFFECQDNLPAARQLFEAAATFAQSHGCEILRGPFNMTAAQELGIVTSGFERAPTIDMVYTPPWYPKLLEQAAFTPCLRMHTWQNNDVRTINLEELRGPAQRALLASGVQIRPLHPIRRAADLEWARELVNAAFLGNWGFVPITPDEWALQTGPLIPILDPELVLYAESQGVPVGVTFAVPDFNRVFIHTRGRLVHPAAIRLLRGPSLKGAVVILFAVRKQYQGLGVSRLLNAALIEALQRRGYQQLSITWIASENTSSRAQAHALEMSPLHELAMFERKL